MEEFIQESRNFSPELLNIGSNPRLILNSPSTSIYSEMSEEMHPGDSPPPWRKSGTGWYRNSGMLGFASGLKSPPRSRETSPLAEDDADFEDGDYTIAARIALPESPLKGRSEERSLSPEVRSSMPRTEYLTPPNSQETAKQDMDTHWNASNTDNNCEYAQWLDAQRD